MQVPQEIVDVIIQQAEGDPTTLRSLCLVSTSFLPKAQQILYHKIRIVDFRLGDIHHVWSIDWKRATKLLKTIVKHNRALAKYIRRLHLLTSGDPEYLALIRQGLKLMDNLEILTSSIVESVLPENPTFRLTNFENDWPCYGHNQSTKRTRFLASQTSLKSLFVLGDTNHTTLDEPFPETFFPKLEALGGDRCAIEKILPGRPFVTKLFWISDGTTLPRPFASRLSSIRVLFLYGVDDKRPDLHLIHPYLPNLQVLHIYGESQTLALHDEFALIPNFRNLRIFVWTAQPFGRSDINRMTKENLAILAMSLFDKTTILERVCFLAPRLEEGILDLPSSKGGLPRYLRWERSMIEPSLVGSQYIAEFVGLFLSMIRLY